MKEAEEEEEEEEEGNRRTFTTRGRRGEGAPDTWRVYTRTDESLLKIFAGARGERRGRETKKKQKKYEEE